MRCIDAQGTDAEAGLFPIQFFLALQHLHGAGVEVGVLRAPQSRAVHAVPEGDGSAFAGLEQEVLPVGEHCRALPADGLLQGHPFCNSAGRLHLCRHIQQGKALVRLPGGDTHGILRQIDLVAHQQPHRAVDAAASIPAAVGFQTVICNDLQQVVGTIFQVGTSLHGKLRITVHVPGQQPAVQVDQRRLVHALKYEGHRLALPRLRCGEMLLKNVLAAGVEAGLCTVFRVRGAGFMDHGIVGQMHGFGLGISQKGIHPGIAISLFYRPICVEILSNHACASFWCSASHFLLAFSTSRKASSTVIMMPITKGKVMYRLKIIRMALSL